MDDEHWEFHSPRTAEALAHWDQTHQRAVDELRKAKTFLLISVRETDAGLETFVHASTCEGLIPAWILLKRLTLHYPEIAASLTGGLASADEDGAA